MGFFNWGCNLFNIEGPRYGLKLFNSRGLPHRLARARVSYASRLNIVILRKTLTIGMRRVPTPQFETAWGQSHISDATRFPLLGAVYPLMHGDDVGRLHVSGVLDAGLEMYGLADFLLQCLGLHRRGRQDDLP